MSIYLFVFWLCFIIWGASKSTGNMNGLVVVLGNEDRGIPAELIENLTACIEIPQFGLTGFQIKKLELL